jgi:hypothetical protein
MRNFIILIVLVAAAWWAFEQGWLSRLGLLVPSSSDESVGIKGLPEITVDELQSVADRASLTRGSVGVYPDPGGVEAIIISAKELGQRPGGTLHHAWLRKVIRYLESVRDNPKVNRDIDQRRLIEDLQDIRRINE